jgi:acyl-coenzyme A thioesterase PaaI-like protein
MTQADCVYSTPPTNTPVDPTRRHLLTIAAGGAVAAAVDIAALAAATAIDPIYAAIERHKEAAVVWDAAVDVWAKFPDGPEPMSIERRIELDRAGKAVQS